MRVAIVGAGVAGLAAGYKLSQAGHEVVVYERSGGVGGRAATRRTHGCVVDHGAQYLTLTDDVPEVKRLVLDELPRDGLLDVGRPVWTFDKDNRIVPGDEERNQAPKWTYRDGLTTLGKRLATGLGVRREACVGVLERTGTGYRLRDVDGAALGEAERVLVAIPAPQASDLLHASSIDAKRRDAALRELEDAPYHAMWTAMLGYAEPPAGTIFTGGSRDDPRPYYALVNADHAHDVSWLAFENDKAPVRAVSGVLVVVAQMSVPYSEGRLDHASDEIAADADREVRGLLGADLGAPLWHDTACWRHARPARTRDLGAINCDHDGLFFAGDYLSGWRLHLALQCGLDVAGLMMDA